MVQWAGEAPSELRHVETPHIQGVQATFRTRAEALVVRLFLEASLSWQVPEPRPGVRTLVFRSLEEAQVLQGLMENTVWRAEVDRLWSRMLEGSDES